jgi:hypothetical protein
MCALLFAALPAAPLAAFAQTAPPLPVDDGATATFNGAPVHTFDLGMLMIAMVWSLGRQMPTDPPHPVAVFVQKPDSEMPASDPLVHFEATDGAQNPHLTIWIASRLGNSPPKDLLLSRVVLGLLASGQGGAALQAMYAKAGTDDYALGADAPDPWQARHALSAQVATTLVGMMRSFHPGAARGT